MLDNGRITDSTRVNIRTSYPGLSHLVSTAALEMDIKSVPCFIDKKIEN